MTGDESQASSPRGAMHFDVIIIGAGLSGICAAYYLQAKCPSKTFVVLEARDTLGGTWDLFRYPGIRSDSDMYTLGYSFRPWDDPQAIADGEAILEYIGETAEEFGIDEKIRYETRVDHVSWSSSDARWTVHASGTAGDEVALTCGFVWACTGYYSYEEGYTPQFEGTEDFAGRIVHPQHWTEDVDYAGKRVIVIGSGATAVTLVPELATEAEHVTMLQRSPTYVISRPQTDGSAEWLKRFLGRGIGYSVTRWKNVLLGILFFEFSQRLPKLAKRYLVDQVREALGPDFDVQTHFTPRYDPWDQRLCLVPDDDLFEAIKEGRASVVTDHIASFTEAGLRLRSGAELEADLIVTATGLQLEFAGGATIDVDGERISPGQKMMYKGTMLSDVPNAAVVVGYTNASWTLKCELACEYVCRLLNYMDARDHAVCCPREPGENLDEVPLIDFSSGYIRRSLGELPHQGSRAPWRLYQNYVLDRVLFRRFPIRDGALEFS